MLLTRSCKACVGNLFEGLDYRMAQNDFLGYVFVVSVFKLLHVALP